MKESILIIGENPLLCLTRASVLMEWQVRTALPKYAREAIRVQSLDVLIFCQSVSDDTFKRLWTLAALMHPTLALLAFCDDQVRSFVPSRCNIGRGDPGLLRSMVIELLGLPLIKGGGASALTGTSHYT